MDVKTANAAAAAAVADIPFLHFASDALLRSLLFFAVVALLLCFFSSTLTSASASDDDGDDCSRRSLHHLLTEAPFMLFSLLQSIHTRNDRQIIVAKKG